MGCYASTPSSRTLPINVGAEQHAGCESGSGAQVNSPLLVGIPPNAGSGNFDHLHHINLEDEVYERSESSVDEPNDFTGFPTCGTQIPIAKKDLEWLHGEVLFEETHLHSKYLIVPEGITDANDVLAVMCSLWNLQIPELFLVLDGGQDTVMGMLSNCLEPDVWCNNVADGGRAAVASFSEGLVKTSKGIAIAAAEAKAWVYGFDGTYGSADGDKMWGTCFNTAWSYFGQGRRTSSSCQQVVYLCSRGLKGLFGERKFRKHASALGQNIENAVQYPSVSHRFQKEGKTVADCVAAEEGKMNRPDRSSMVWPEFTHIVLYDGDAGRYPFPDLYQAMKVLTSTVHVVVGGVHPTLTNSVVDESDAVPICVLRHTGGAADVIAKALDHKSKKQDTHVDVLYRQSADYLLDEREEWKSLKWSTMNPVCRRWFLPPNIKEQNFAVIDVKRDKTLNIVEKILRVHSRTDDWETRRFGAAGLETDSLQRAWKSTVSYKYNADNFAIAYGLYSYALMAISVISVLAAVVHGEHVQCEEQFAMFPAEGSLLTVRLVLEWTCEHTSFQILMIALPLLFGFLLSCLSRFSPQQKWNQLTNAANLVKAEIYRYRSRVGEYVRRQGHALDITERIRRMPIVNRELLCRKTAQMGGLVPSQVSSAATTPKGSLSLDAPSPETMYFDLASVDFSKELFPRGGDDQPRKKKDAGLKAKTRRMAFQDRMEQVHTELANGAVRLSSLADPSRRAVRNERSALVGTHNESPSTLQRFGAEFNPESHHDERGRNQADDGFSNLLAEDYMHFRVYPAITNLSRISRGHERAIFWLETTRYVTTMFCVVLAVLNLTMLVPLVVSFIGVITMIMDFHQFIMRLQAVNSAVTELRNLVIWWESLSMAEQRSRSVMEYIVDVTEMAIHADLVGVRISPNRPAKEERVEPADPLKDPGEESEEE